MSWESYQKGLVRYSNLGVSLDTSRINFGGEFSPAGLASKCAGAFADMRALEAGEIANPDEGRKVGHYWLRDASLAPTTELKGEVEEGIACAKGLAQKVHAGELVGASGKFTRVLVVGIGGSALGPQLVADCLTDSNAPMEIAFLDNTDPDGFDRVLGGIGASLGATLTLVISKSGGTKETRNGMLEVAAVYEAAGLDFAAHAVAITGKGSQLDQYAEAAGWLERIPMADWIGGRTSVMSVVGLVPAALQGVDLDAFLEGARAMDVETRVEDPSANMAMMLALSWYAAGAGKGERDMVVLPYKDRLALFSKYLQQLVMESLGKELDLAGNTVHQGLSVYGNKGSTDQHAYIQQLRDGPDNFMAVFVEVLSSRTGASIEVEPGVTSGDYLQGFLRGTRAALTEGGRQSVTLTLNEIGAYQLGTIIALFERAVSFYASLVNINAYHQPGVEAGKKAAGVFLEVLASVRAALGSCEGAVAAAEIAEKVGASVEDVYHCLNHIAANDAGVTVELGATPGDDRFVRA
jgi:glucose-6-phosphate isomerase